MRGNRQCAHQDDEDDPGQQSVQARPLNPVGLYLGMAYLRAGDLIKAQQSLEQALALNAKFDGADETRKAVASLQ